MKIEFILFCIFMNVAYASVMAEDKEATNKDNSEIIAYSKDSENNVKDLKDMDDPKVGLKKIAERIKNLENVEKKGKKTLDLAEDFLEALKKEPANPIKYTMVVVNNGGLNISKDRLSAIQETIKIAKAEEEFLKSLQ